MILIWLIIIPLIGGLIAWPLGRKNSAWPRWISIASIIVDAILLTLLCSQKQTQDLLSLGTWFVQVNEPWIPQFGSSIHLALDGLSLVLVTLTLFLGLISIICSWNEIRDRVGFFHMNLLWVLSGILGVFMTLDLFLFYFFWELMLVPMYFLINIWGHENRAYASIKFFIFTQAGGLLMLLSILGLFLVHGNATGNYTFDYSLLLGTPMTSSTAFWIMLGFLIAFLVKVPVFPFHPWLPDAHTEAPTAGSVILAGLLLKTGAYGLLRFVVPLFPGASASISTVMMVLAVIGIIYGAVLAFGQIDLKRLVAYTSVSHMGFVLLGIFAGNLLSLSGAVVQMVAHGVSTGALFIIVGMIQERVHTRDMEHMGGYWSLMPRLSSVGLVFALASLGLPGFGNFVAEFMVLLGTFRVSGTITAVAAGGLVLAAIYSLWIVQRVFHGEVRSRLMLPDLTLREAGVMASLIAVIFWLGLYPGPVLQTVEPVLKALVHSAPQEQMTVFQEGRE